jgi:glutamate 5-kinase
VDWLEGLAADVAELRGQDKAVVLVSSGSIALGRRALALGPGPLTLEQSQAAAAVGQIRLAQAYESALAPHGQVTAQVLLTLEDSENRRRYLNSRRTFETLLELGVAPIVNENDTVATDEIRYGDNDRLAAQVAAMAGADVLVLLSDVDGLYTADPRVDAGARRLDLVAAVTPEIEAMAGGTGTALSSGGMKTKLMAAKAAMRAGCAMAIARGAVDRPLSALAEGAPCTWFEAHGDPHVARKRWISGMKPRGRVTVDAGAVAALLRGKSLLPAGVVRVEGAFGRGDPVEIAGPDGAVEARALAGYDAREAGRVKGPRSDRFADRLGQAGRAALVPRVGRAF